MSGKIAGLCWDLELDNRDMLVLQALADHSDHEGNNAFPSLDLLAWKTGYSEQTVRRALKDLTAAKITIAVKRPGRTTKYSIRPQNGKQKPPRKVVDIDECQDVTPDILGDDPLHPDTTPDSSMSGEPSLETSLVTNAANPGGASEPEQRINFICKTCGVIPVYSDGYYFYSDGSYSCRQCPPQTEKPIHYMTDRRPGEVGNLLGGQFSVWQYARYTQEQQEQDGVTIEIETIDQHLEQLDSTTRRRMNSEWVFGVPVVPNAIHLDGDGKEIGTGRSLEEAIEALKTPPEHEPGTQRNAERIARGYPPGFFERTAGCLADNPMPDIDLDIEEENAVAKQDLITDLGYLYPDKIKRMFPDDKYCDTCGLHESLCLCSEAPRTFERHESGYRIGGIDPFADKNDPTAPPASPLIPDEMLPPAPQSMGDCTGCGKFGERSETVNTHGQFTKGFMLCAACMVVYRDTLDLAPALTAETMSDKHIGLIATLAETGKPQRIAECRARQSLLAAGYIRKPAKSTRLNFYELTDEGATLARIDQRVQVVIERKRDLRATMTAQGQLPAKGKRNGKSKKFTISPEYLPVFNAMCEAFETTPDMIPQDQWSNWAKVASQLTAIGYDADETLALHAHCVTQKWDKVFGVDALLSQSVPFRAAKKTAPEQNTTIIIDMSNMQESE